MVEELKKTEQNLPLIRKMMQTTFALRRQTVVKNCPPVKEFMDLLPALKMESEECNSFYKFNLSAPLLWKEQAVHKDCASE
ncbi:sterile alpha motif domain-containing 3 [Labeo rohita]|uniref:Sterile alpha motif domain-containing 3 n=1 Tax=Labeo rohita TaxID=84645 RepID=A0A498M0Q2_LABRO|nr:sterile alpha motif domain-containing 3 [Labeo rohita]